MSKEFGGNVQVEAFSALKGIGVDQVRSKLDEWYAPELERQRVLAADDSEVFNLPPIK